MTGTGRPRESRTFEFGEMHEDELLKKCMVSASPQPCIKNASSLQIPSSISDTIELLNFYRLLSIIDFIVLYIRFRSVSFALFHGHLQIIVKISLNL